MLLAELAGRTLELPGIGPALRGRLANLGIVDERDLLLHLPRSWQDRSRYQAITASAEPLTVRGTVTDLRQQPLRGGRRLLRVGLDVDGERATLVCFNRDFLARSWPVGTVLLVYGKFERQMTGWECSTFDALPEGDPQAATEFGRVIPVYPLTEGITQRVLRKALHRLLDRYPDFPEALPDWLRQRRKMPRLVDLLRQLHFPETLAAADLARRELAYSEFLLFQAGVRKRSLDLGAAPKPHCYADIDLTEQLQTAFGFAFTDGQRAAWNGIRAALASRGPMQRLLLGDVGSGKTAVAAAAALFAVKSGIQVALAAPTIILARQIHDRFRHYLGPLGVRLLFLGGSMTAAGRREALAAIAAGGVDLVVGTHALFQPDVVFARLGLVLIDEQHRFGVNQRQALLEKGCHADYLAMSATPIPRSLALALYGDFSISRIDGLPAGRLPVATKLLRGDAREAWRDLEPRLARGEQAYLVYPLIDDAGSGDAAAAVRAHAGLAASELGRYGVGLLHGRLDDDEKIRVLEEFSAGRLKLLVATTVIEVGIDTPQATTIIIHDAERFGLSQLHQLRGRVGRGRLPSVCWLVAGRSASEESLRRLQVLATTHDGFKIAEADLALRGPGDFLGVAQAGLPPFRIGNLGTDAELLALARQDAEFILGRDPDLSSPHNAPLAALLAGQTSRVGGSA